MYQDNNNLNTILEDRSIKFGNEVYPSNGWAIFMAGGPAASKSSTINNQLMLDGKVIDNDDITAMYLKTLKKVLNSPGTSEEIKDEIINIFGDVTHLSPKNLAYSNVFRQKVADNKQFMSKIIGIYAKSNRLSLQNVIIDSTSSNIAVMIQTALLFQSYGYKLGLVWVVANINNAINRNMERNRTVDVDYLIDTHKKLLSTLPKFFSNGTLWMFNEVWLIFSKNVSDFSMSFNEKYANTAIKLDKVDNNFILPKKVHRRAIKLVDKEHLGE